MKYKKREMKFFHFLFNWRNFGHHITCVSHCVYAHVTQQLHKYDELCKRSDRLRIKKPDFKVWDALKFKN